MTGDERNPTNAQEELSNEEQFAEFLKASEQGEQQQEQQEPEAQPEPAQTQAQSDADWLASANIPDDVRERVRQEIEQREAAKRDFENRWKAQAGQLAPTQKKVAELERQLRETQAKQQMAAQSAGMTEDAWARYEREFPEESAAFKARLNPLQEQVQTMASQLEEWRQEREFAEATRQLAQQHPDWRQFDDDPVFGQWFDAQPEQVKRMFPDGQRANPADVSWLLSEFKRAEQVALILEQQQQQPTVTASPKAQAVVARREQQKRDPTTAIRTGQSAPLGRRNATGDSEEDAFAAFLAENPP